MRPDGSVALELGPPDRAVFPRSANKPLQAVALLECGWRPGSEELALAAASHSGRAEHLAVVRRALGPLPEEALQCPPALPLDESAAAELLATGGGPTRLHMNCSGKHAGMLATCRVRGWSTADYLDGTSPLQVAVTAAVERLAGERVAAVAVDGCGAPQHALSLRALVRAFSRLVTARDAPEREVADAVRAHPDLVGGPGRDVTALMRAVPGLLAKDGAEGVYAAVLPDGSAVAVKIEDGGGRARVPALTAGLRALGVPAEQLAPLARLPVLGGGRPVGEVRVAGPLLEV